MKATGIVRRIDELGRVVIPKEIRRTLRIREGDPLEIFTDKDGGIILKKYSPIGELSQNALELAQSLNTAFSLPCAVCDKDAYVSGAGFGKRDVSGRAIAEDMERAIVQRNRIVSLTPGEERYLLLREPDANFVCTARVVVPILSLGDAIGAVCLVSQKPDVGIDPAAVKACETVANFLGRQMEQ